MLYMSFDAVKPHIIDLEAIKDMCLSEIDNSLYIKYKDDSGTHRIIFKNTETLKNDYFFAVRQMLTLKSRKDRSYENVDDDVRLNPSDRN